MTFAGWLLAETGELSPLLPGTCPADLLESGPTFEVALRSCPPAKLVYGHVPTANVNAAASRIAGHAVKGDACLVVSPFTDANSRNSTNSSGASSSSSSHAAGSVQLPSPDLLLDSLLGGSRLAQQLLANPRKTLSPPSSSPPHSPAQQQPHAAAAAASPHKHARCPHAAISAILQGRNALISAAPAGLEAAAGSSRGSGVNVGHEVPTTKAPSALGRAPSWEEPLAPPYKSARNSLESPPHPPHLPRPQHRPLLPAHSLAGALAAAVASGDGIARPASPGVSRLARQLAGSGLLGGSGSGVATAGLHNMTGAGASGLAHKRRHSSEASEAPLAFAAAAATSAAAAACMELEEGGLTAAEPLGLQAPLVTFKPRRSLQETGAQQEPLRQCPRVSVAAQAHQESGTVAAPQQPAAVEVEVPWQELPCDVVAYVATQLPQQASQAAAMAGVCRGWRVALLGNMPALRRITFNLDPANHLRTSTTSTPATAIGGSSSAADGSTSSAGSGVCVGLRRRSAARDASGAADQQAEEERAMAAALGRQYGAGAFVLPSAHTAAGGLEGMEGAGHWGAGGAEEQEEPEREAKEPVVPRAAARRPPALLLEAARGASNPSAQLLMAQLLEGSGDADGSLRWWRKLAIAGDVMGMFKLGMACYDGSHGMQSDPEAAHMWLSRAVRHILQVDSLSAIQLDEQHGGGPGAPAAGAAAAAATAGGAVGGSSTGGGGTGAGGQPRVSLRMRRKLAALDPTLLRMLGWSSIVLGYLEFDGVAGRSVWGMGDRSEAVRLFRLAEGCGCTEAAAVLGWLYNTGQY